MAPGADIEQGAQLALEPDVCALVLERVAHRLDDLPVRLLVERPQGVVVASLGLAVQLARSQAPKSLRQLSLYDALLTEDGDGGKRRTPSPMGSHRK